MNGGGYENNRSGFIFASETRRTTEQGKRGLHREGSVGGGGRDSQKEVHVGYHEQIKEIRRKKGRSQTTNNG